MTISIKEMFAFLEIVSQVLKDRADNSKHDLGIETTILSDGRSVGEHLRQLNKPAVLAKLIKLDSLENKRREKNRKRRVKSHSDDSELSLPQ
jgi:hypothetical protein